MREEFKELQAYFTHTAYLADARRTMYNVQHFDTRDGDAVDNQMSVEDDVAVHAAFGRNVAAWWINDIRSGSESTALFIFCR